MKMDIIEKGCKHGELFTCYYCSYDILRADNKALRKELAALKQSIPKVRADAIRDFADYMQDYEVDPHGFNERAVKLADDYANKIEAE
jgi:hypothetical protein